MCSFLGGDIKEIENLPKIGARPVPPPPKSASRRVSGSNSMTVDTVIDKHRVMLTRISGYTTINQIFRHRRKFPK